MRPQQPKSDSCKACPRYNDSRCTPSSIPSGGQLDVLFVCDQPDLISASNNEPLYGHSGNVVKTAVRFVSQDNSDFLNLRLRYTYCVQCVDLKETPASRQIVDYCKVNLESTIAVCPPKLIVAMGANPLKYLGIKGSHKDLRGRLITNTRYGIPIFITFSEKALLAQPGLFSVFKLDLKNIFEHVLGKREVATLEELSAEYVFPQTVEEVKILCDTIADYAREGHPAEWAISVDTETTTLHPEKLDSRIIAFCIGWDKGKATTILYDHPKAPPEYLARLDEVTVALNKLLSSGKPKIFHNAKFDLKFIESKYGINVNNVKWDTLLGEHLLDEDKKGNYGLKVLTAGWLPKYCGYEDKLYELLTASENAGDDDLLDKRIKELSTELSEAQRHYLDELAAYKIAKEQYLIDKLTYDKELTVYTTAKEAHQIVYQQYATMVRVWELGNGQGKKPKRPVFSGMKKPKPLIKPKEPKDPRSKKEKQVQTDAGFETLPIKDLAIYGAIDADVTRQLAKLQIARIAKEKSRVASLMSSHAIPVSRVLGRAEFHGTRIDHKYIDVLEPGLTRIIEDCETELYQMAGTTQPSGKPLNIASPQQIGNILYNWGWTHPDGTKMPPYPVVDTTDKGLPSTADKTLKQFLEYEDREAEIPTKAAFFIERYGRWKKAKKAKETFLANIRLLSRKDGFLHTSFHINGTGTGRLSSSDMNLQNIPKYLAGWNIKKLFIPSNDDLVICNCDYKGAEVRVFTVYAPDKGLIDAINNGLDMHSYFAAKVYGRPYEDYANRDNPTLLPDKNYRKQLDKERTQIKRVVFGILYGAGKYKIAETIGVSIEIAQQLIRTLYDMFNAIEEYGMNTEREVRERGFVETVFGRRRRFPLHGLSRHQSRAFRQAKNFKIQSTSSDIVMGQLVEVEERLRLDYGGRMLMTVHDSMVFEFPKKHLTQLKDFLTFHGEISIEKKYPWLPVPFKMDIEVGPSYGEVQSINSYLKEHPFTPTPEGVIEEQELLNELREDAFQAA